MSLLYCAFLLFLQLHCSWETLWHKNWKCWKHLWIGTPYFHNWCQKYSFSLLEQIPRFPFQHCNIPDVWCCHHGSHLPQHGHNDGGNVWAKWNKDKHPRQNQCTLCYHLHCRMCAEIAGSEAVLFLKCLEHIWFSCCYYVTCW